MIEDLRAFVAVIEEASLTRAAANLCVTQSAISKRIQRLEETLGAELFDRNSKPPRATALANRIYEHAVPLLKNLERLLKIPKEDGAPAGTFRFGLPPAIADIVLFDSVVEMKAEFAALDVRLHTESSPELDRMVRRGELDAAAIILSRGTTPSEEHDCNYITALEVLVVQSNGKPQVAPDRSIKSLASQEWVLNPQGCGYRAALERAMDDAGGGLRLGVDTYGAEMQLRLVAAGTGLGLVSRGVLSRSAWRDRLSVVELSDFSLWLDVWLVHPRQLGNLKRAAMFLGGAMQGSFIRYNEQGAPDIASTPSA